MACRHLSIILSYHCSSHMIAGKPVPNVNLDVNLGVPYLPQLKKDSSDRNRTNPFAFTGNKFEVSFLSIDSPPCSIARSLL